MDTTKAIQIAVARADLIVSSALRWLAIIAALSVVLLLGVLAFHRIMWNDHYHWQDPYWIDYDAPGVDITSEGPDDDYTDAWNDWR
jgi:hypothetical protein